MNYWDRFLTPFQFMNLLPKYRGLFLVLIGIKFRTVSSSGGYQVLEGIKLWRVSSSGLYQVLGLLKFWILSSSNSGKKSQHSQFLSTFWKSTLERSTMRTYMFHLNR
jgi:hypothetical protein